MTAADKLDWANIGFRYRDTNGFMKYTWTLEKGWDNGSFETDPMQKVHICASGLHYGQQCFEGLKAFKDKQGRVRIFRPQDNAARMNRSAPIAYMPEVPEEIFLEGCRRTVEANIDYVPPVETGGAFYLRPLLFGSGPMIGMDAAPEFTFLVFGTPVSNYYKDGIKPVKALVMETIDRAAPKGTGSAKLGGNYAPTFGPMHKAMAEGYTITLHLDSKTREYVDEFSTSNFVALTAPDANGVRTFVTPNSESILRSVTRLSLIDICEKLGWKVEQRPIKFSEIEQGKFDEVAACGTAVVLTPVKSITRGDKVITIGDQDVIGKGFETLYNYYRGVQNGEIEDSFGWMYPSEGLA
ncbi:branched-chain amino acid aminotransferase [Fennellomyces sp. T-0311]|nr:branched-chain amino acid aminotransferase [Fennellomyces sp. T-0311]